MKGEQGKGRKRGQIGGAPLWILGGESDRGYRGYRGRGKQNMYGMTAGAAQYATKGQINDIKDFTGIIQMKCGVRVEYILSLI